jgi:hypothetical protein
MKTSKTWMVLLVSVVALCFETTAFGASCSNASMKGGYGFSVTGYDKSGNLLAVVGQFNANGKGSLTGVETESDNGQVLANVPIKGTYTIKSDCNGSAVIAAKGGKGSKLDVVVVGGGKAVQLLAAATGKVQSAIAQSQGKETCTDAGVKGTFGVLASGNFTGVGNVAFSGQITLDGAGNLSGTDSGSIAGQIFTDASVSGTYSVNSNCTGSATLQVTGEAAQHVNFVVFNGGQNLYLIETDSNTTVSGEGQQ